MSKLISQGLMQARDDVLTSEGVGESASQPGYLD
jgi:hypothetical protein